MDRVKNYFNKSWNPAVMDNDDPMPNFAHEHLCLIYWTLFKTAAFSLFGAYWHLLYSTGSYPIITASFVGSICCLSKIPPSHQVPRLTLLLYAAYCFGALFGPLINFILVVDQSDIVQLFKGAFIFFLSYYVSILYSHQRHVIYRMGDFLSTTLIPTWVILSPYSHEVTMSAFFLSLVIVFSTAVYIHDFMGEKLIKKVLIELSIQILWYWFLSHHFSFSVYKLVLVYWSIGPFAWHMPVQSQQTIYRVIHGENDYLNHTIAFVTDFPTLIFLGHFGGIMLRDIRRTLGTK